MGNIYRSSCVYRTYRFIHIRMTMCQGFIHAPASSFPSTHVLSITIKFHSGQMSTITMNGVGRRVASAQDKLSRWRLVTSSRHHMYDIQPALLLSLSSFFSLSASPVYYHFKFFTRILQFNQLSTKNQLPILSPSWHLQKRKSS